MKESACFPTVLIVDDDPACTAYWRSKFERETCIGIITASSLSEGRRFLDDTEIHIHGIVCDIYFERGTDSEHHLSDGIDLLTYAARRRPGLRQYVTSFFAEDHSYQVKAKESGLSVLPRVEAD